MASILVIMGNPKQQSLCDSICDEYVKGAKQSGHEVSIVKLNQYSIDTKTPSYNPEDWIAEKQKQVQNCDHIVFITPMWWGNMTSALKSYIDQVFMSGITFKYRDDGGYDKLCVGKTSEVIITSDTPKWVFFTFMGAPLIKIFKMQILEFCGFKFKRATLFSQTINSTPKQRQKWLFTAKELGETI